MRIFSTALLTATFLGAATSPGWCPADVYLDGPLGGTGVPGSAHISRPKPKDPLKMTPSERANLLQRERAAGRVKTTQDAVNFVRTGDAKTPYVPPLIKSLPANRPSSVSQAQWDKLQTQYKSQQSQPAQPPPVNAAASRRW